MSWRTFGAYSSHPRLKSRSTVSREGGGLKPHPRVGACREVARVAGPKKAAVVGTRNGVSHVRQCAYADAQRREARPARTAWLAGRGSRALHSPLAIGLAGRIRAQRP